MKFIIYIPFLLILALQSCVTLQNKPAALSKRFSEVPAPALPDYSKEAHWAALPTKKDCADSLPDKRLKDEQANAPADVFFVYPTIYLDKPTSPHEWNADVNDAQLNNKIDNSTILNQASVFNASGKIYSPRYRQAHIHAYWTPNKDDAKQAFDLAYEDVKAAFDYYLKNYNQGRPFIIASHSQGTQHATRLVQEFIDGKPLQKQLVAAYLVGMPTLAKDFKVLKPCDSPDQIGCYNTWCTYAKDYYPPTYNEKLKYAVCTNPLSWKLDETYIPYEVHKGGVMQGFKPSKLKAVDAQVHQGMLWINKPYISGRLFLKVKNWHVADYNLFYMDVRENAKARVDAFMKTYKASK